MNVFYIHFHAMELEERMAAMTARGWTVRGHSTVGERALIGDPLPDALLLSLDRVPSHSYAYADWFWQAKKRQSIPIVFIGGTEKTVESARTRYPDAHFSSFEELPNLMESIK
ncbi:MAG TPA: hypothetical protein VK171_01325 [Fimbriimonas sp.]|nr:hypothetical protein [Fimbriimonas sp.]